jgi:hypothetical protein
MPRQIVKQRHAILPIFQPGQKVQPVSQMMWLTAKSGERVLIGTAFRGEILDPPGGTRLAEGLVLVKWSNGFTLETPKIQIGLCSS